MKETSDLYRYTGSIQQLREQVRSGAYRAEPESIAAAMLLEVRA